MPEAAQSELLPQPPRFVHPLLRARGWQARTLVEQYRCWRRKEELEAAEKVILQEPEN